MNEVYISYKTRMGSYKVTKLECSKDDIQVDNFVNNLTAKGYKLLSILGKTN